MILIDVGNTSIHFAKAKGLRIVKTTSLRGKGASLKAIEKILSGYAENGIVVCSVVPHITAVLSALARKRQYNISIVGKDIKIPITCLYNKKHVGMDRLVGAFAANILYPHARIIIDFGSATTVDFISKKKEYEGGFILPGIGSSLRVLSECALLPKKIELTQMRPSSASSTRIPRDTDESIYRGVTEGFSIMINAMIKKYAPKDTAQRKTIIITGGDAGAVMPYLDFRATLEPLLVLKGLMILADRYARISKPH